MNEIGLELLDEELLCFIGRKLTSTADSPSSADTSPTVSIRPALAKLLYPEVMEFGPMPIICLSNDSRFPRLVGRLLEDEQLDEVQFDAAELKKYADRIHDGFARIKSVAPTAAFACTCIGQIIVLANCVDSRAGSNAKCIGALWLSPTNDWSESEFAENLLHESLHSLIFVLEMMVGIFQKSMIEMEAEKTVVSAVSAIRKVRRRYDLAFHSAVVACVLATFRVLDGRLGDAESGFDPLVVSLDSLWAGTENLTPFGQAILASTTRQALKLRSML